MTPHVVVFNNMITPYTNRLYNELVDRGVRLSVLSCTVEEKDRAWAGLIDPKYPHRVVPGISFALTKSRYTHVNFGVGRALSALAPDILFVNGFFPSMLSAAAWAKSHGKKLGLTIDGWRETMPDTVYHRIARPWLIGHCGVIVCCSQKGMAYFRDQGVPEHRIYLAPLVPAWDPPAKLAAYRDRPFSLLWCARINDDAKNAAFFEDVVIALNRKTAGLVVRIIGSGTAEGRMLARFSAEKVNFLHDPHVPWHAMSKVYEQSRLLVLPSLLEPWGLVCNEAMQCGVPCMVSPHVGAAGELVRHGENGYICELDVDRWVATAQGLLEDANRWDTISMRARQSANGITLANTASSFIAAAESLLPRLKLTAEAHA
jgi:glycosyltransferase involved in cell wall biosynthesis